jgi:small subunit ribosomal protein S3
MLVAEGISEQLKRRASFRRTMKQRAENCIQAGAKGVKIQISGRLGGAEMSRTEMQNLGSVPLQTLEADVDYGFVPCYTTYGTIGVKVWIYRGMFGDEDHADGQQAGPSGRDMTRARRRRSGGGGGRSGHGRGRRDEAPKPQPRPGGSRLGALRARQEAEAKEKKADESAQASEQASKDESTKQESAEPKGEASQQDAPKPEGGKEESSE